MRTVARALFSAVIVAAPIAAAAQQASDAELARFRTAYTSGEGLAYVVINDAAGEHIYRYGDVSRLTAKKNPRGYMLFTCTAPHVFLPEKPEVAPIRQTIRRRDQAWLFYCQAASFCCCCFFCFCFFASVEKRAAPA